MVANQEGSISLRLLLSFLCVMPVLANAASVPSPEIIKDNSGLFQWILAIALLANGFFIKRTTDKVQEK